MKISKIGNIIIYSMLLGSLGGILALASSTCFYLYKYRKVRLLYDSLKESKKYYVYNPFNFDDGYVFPLDRIEDSDLYKTYYQLQEKQVTPNFSINKNVFFALKGVFAKHELIDTSIITIYTIDTICWTVNKKYVFTKLVREYPPKSDSINNIIFNVETMFGYKCNNFESYNVLKKYIY